MSQLFLVSHWAPVWYIVFLTFLIRGLPWDGALHTAVQNVQDYHGSSPVPTEPPTVAQRDLLPRQNGGQICGFVNADINSAIQCPAGYQCAINPFNYAAGCCIDPSYCEYHTACVPFTSMGACGAACQSDMFVTRCTDVAYPYCYARYFEVFGYSEAFYEVGCAAHSGTVTAYQTYTNAPAQSQDITPQVFVVTTTASIPYTTTPEPAASGGIVVNCGGGGNSNTCNVGAGNNGNGEKSGSAASSRFSIPDSGLLIRAFTFWIVTELFVFAFS